MNLQVTSTCEAHKTLEGLQKSEMTCWKKGEMARGRCGRRDLVFSASLHMVQLSHKGLFVLRDWDVICVQSF